MESQGRIVKAVARSIRTCIEVDLGGEIDFAWAERTNETGWNLEIPSGDKAAAARGTTVRHEGIVLGDRELARAWELANR
jgi:hypothetical protein